MKAKCERCGQMMNEGVDCIETPLIDSNGDFVKRIPYDNTSRPCHDCGVISGQFHHKGCDWERCPQCGGQLISCDCALKTEIDTDAHLHISTEQMAIIKQVINGEFGSYKEQAAAMTCAQFSRAHDNASMRAWGSGDKPQYVAVNVDGTDYLWRADNGSFDGWDRHMVGSGHSVPENGS